MMTTNDSTASINYKEETQGLDVACDTAYNASYNTAANDRFGTPG